MYQDESILNEIDRYLRNEMAEEERTAFESKMDSDNGLKRDVQLTEDLKKGIILSAENRIKQSLKEVEKNLEHQNFFKPKSITMENKRTVRWVPIAAAIAFLASAIIFMKSSNSVSTNPGELYAQYYKPDSKVIKDVLDRLEARGLASKRTTKDDSLVVALTAYKKYDYQTARTNLSKYLDSYPEDQTARFYMGLTQLQMSNYAAATGYLQPLCTEEGFPYQDAAKWYLAMGCSQIDGPDGMTLTVKYLKELVEDTTSDYHSNAKAYLHTLEQ